jgi:ABC-type Fe3+-hydroxamate transport system substrate-binding protein
MNPTHISTDQLGRKVTISLPLQKIVSLVPSQTELLFDLGLDDEVAGITKFCVHPPEWFRNKTRVGGTKQLNLEKIAALHPDLLIANKEENTEEQITALAQKFPVWISDIQTLDDACRMIFSVGEMVQKQDRASQLIARIETSFQSLHFEKRPPACYLIWKDPLMTVGGDTFIHHLLMQAGFENVFADRRRYPEISAEEILEKNPRYLLLSSEPFPFSAKHVHEFQAEFPQQKIMPVDGEMFSWYGSRLLLAPAYFQNLWNELDGDAGQFG